MEAFQFRCTKLRVRSRHFQTTLLQPAILAGLVAGRTNVQKIQDARLALWWRQISDVENQKQRLTHNLDNSLRHTLPIYLAIGFWVSPKYANTHAADLSGPDLLSTTTPFLEKTRAWEYVSFEKEKLVVSVDWMPVLDSAFFQFDRSIPLTRQLVCKSKHCLHSDLLRLIPCIVSSK